MKSIFLQFAAIAAAAGLTGCTNVATFEYTSAPGTLVRFQEKGTARKSIAVLPFIDQRGTKYFDPQQKRRAALHPVGDNGSLSLGLIPLYPAGATTKEEPENSEDFVSLGRYHFNPAQDLADAAAVSLKASNLFSSVQQVGSPEQAKTDYLWRGKVTSTYYKGYMYSYCITYFLAPALWLIGAPSGMSVNELWVRFELVERAGGKVVWSYEYRGSDYLMHWLYARVGQDASLYPQLMKQAMNGALYDLNAKFKNQ